MSWFEADIKIIIMSAIYYLVSLWKWFKNMNFQITFTKIINNENMKIVIR